MATIKDEIDIPGRKTLRAWMFGIGAIFGLAAYGATQNSDGQTFLMSAALSGGFIFIGAKMKTTKKLQGTISSYR